MIEMFLDCVPPTASHHQKHIIKMKRFSKRLKRIVVVSGLADEPELVKAKNTIDKLLHPHRPAAPLDGTVALTLEFTWPWRQSDPKRVRGAGRILRNTRPDCSNLAKTTEDRLVAMGFLGDDGQVGQLIVRKYFGARPGIFVRLEPIAEAPLFHDDQPAAAKGRDV